METRTGSGGGGGGGESRRLWTDGWENVNKASLNQLTRERNTSVPFDKLRAKHPSVDIRLAQKSLCFIPF